MSAVRPVFTRATRVLMALVLALTPALVLGAPATAYAAPVTVTFADPNLETVVRSALAKPTGTVTDSDMRTLTALDGSNTGIADLGGLQYATNLQSLDLAGDQITTITELAGLTHLASLDLDYDAVSSLAPLAGMAALESLSIAGDGTYSDLTPLSGKPGLTWLTLSSPNITSIQTLSGLHALDQLDLYAPGLTDLSPLAGLTGLETLRLANDALSVAPLSSLTNLASLSLTGSTIDTLAPLSSLTNLTDLDIEVGTVSDLTPISTLTGLVSLRVASDSLTTITPIASLTNLESLVLSYDQIADISPLAGLEKLDALDLGGNSIADLSPLSGLTSLESVSLQDNLLADIGPLVGLPSLTDVTLDHNWLDLTPGHPADLAIQSLEASGVAVYATPQNSSVGRPVVAPSTRRRNKKLTFTSGFSPASAAPAVSVKLKLYHSETKTVKKRVGGKLKSVKVKYWHLRRTVTMKGSATGRLTAGTTCAYTGSWQAFVVFAGSDMYEASTSDVRTFTVK